MPKRERLTDRYLRDPHVVGFAHEAAPTADRFAVDERLASAAANEA